MFPVDYILQHACYHVWLLQPRFLILLPGSTRRTTWECISCQVRWMATVHSRLSTTGGVKQIPPTVRGQYWEWNSTFICERQRSSRVSLRMITGQISPRSVQIKSTEASWNRFNASIQKSSEITKKKDKSQQEDLNNHNNSPQVRPQNGTAGTAHDKTNNTALCALRVFSLWKVRPAKQEITCRGFDLISKGWLLTT